MVVRRPSPISRWSTALRWPVGIAVTSWRYMWQTTPVHRWELNGTLAEDGGPDLPAGVDERDLQVADDGTGTLFHRVYRTSIRGSALRAPDLMRQVTGDLDAVAPLGLARFQKVRGDEAHLRVGDEYVVRIPGPWDGPVRVVAVAENAFRLATMKGHLEAGQIEFRAHQTARSIEFVIESWARSGDRFSDVLYTNLRMAKEVQLHMWTSVLTRVTALAGGEMRNGIRVITHRVGADDSSGAAPDRDRARLARLRDLPVNYDPAHTDPTATGAGWHIDDLSAELPGEASGEPVAGGSWQVARQLMNGYQIADPHRVRGIFDHQAPLQGRDMLLEIRFMMLRAHVGVRVTAPYEEIRTVDGRDAHVFGWAYQTLDGHFEQGEMHYQLWKWLDDGSVEFRIHAYSRPAKSGPLWLRLGFRLVGRRQQLQFYRTACRRIRRLTESELELADVRRREQNLAPPTRTQPAAASEPNE